GARRDVPDPRDGGLVRVTAVPRLRRVTETAHEAAPIESPLSGLVVMKFGGTSVADPEKIKRAAARLVEAKTRGAPGARGPSAGGHHAAQPLPPRHGDLAAPQAARHGHADLDRRAADLRPRRDGDPRPRPRGDLV